jgi:hypothetical protein
MCNKSQGFYGLNSTLSPAAQAVIKKVQATLPDYMISDRTAGFFAAAVMRAAADQVVPEEPWHSQLPIDHRGWYSRQRYMTRGRLLAIAAELEGADA